MERGARSIVKSKSKTKAAFDIHRHNNIYFTVGEIVVMKRGHVATGESTKLQDRYRGPLVITEQLPGDVYRVVELDSIKKSRFTTTAHMTQLKSWKLGEEAEPELELNDRRGMVRDRTKMVIRIVSKMKCWNQKGVLMRCREDPFGIVDLRVGCQTMKKIFNIYLLLLFSLFCLIIVYTETISC